MAVKYTVHVLSDL